MCNEGYWESQFNTSELTKTEKEEAKRAEKI
jgi:hypothetical protein